MPRRRLIWQIYPPFLFILLIALIALAVYDAFSLNTLYRQQTEAHLEGLARVVAGKVGEVWSGGTALRFERLAQDAGEASSTRITILSATGEVLGDSDLNPVDMDNHRDREEIREALAGRVGRSVRHSFTTREETIYVAVPLVRDEAVAAVVRVAVSSDDAAGPVRSVYRRLLLGALLVAAVAVLLSVLAWRRISRQIEQIKAGVESYMHEGTPAPLPVSDRFELADLSESLNKMGARFQERMRTVLRQRNELDSVLKSMLEGVIAVDGDERVINLNDAAADLLQTTRDAAAGRTIQEVIRNTQLQRFVGRTLRSRGVVEADITLFRDSERTLHARGTVLRDGVGESIGGVIVLDDVTLLRKLEAARSEFVANVSHEIRTPITSIQGYVETLLDGALEDPEQAERFLRIVLSQAERLDTLVKDMLSLARIERDEESAELAREPVRLREVLLEAVRACHAQVAGRGVRVEVRCDEELTGSLNGALIEQAVMNLVDNAIKYSESGAEVEVEAGEEAGLLAIHVRDSGCGIAAEHLPRLFERFYRVDRARSRKLGGTGLGLSIVKHIALLHGGRVDVESTPGKGSRFSIYLPCLIGE